MKNFYIKGYIIAAVVTVLILTYGFIAQSKANLVVYRPNLVKYEQRPSSKPKPVITHDMEEKVEEMLKELKKTEEQNGLDCKQEGIKQTCLYLIDEAYKPDTE